MRFSLRGLAVLSTALWLFAGSTVGAAAQEQSRSTVVLLTPTAYSSSPFSGGAGSITYDPDGTLRSAFGFRYLVPNSSYTLVVPREAGQRIVLCTFTTNTTGAGDCQGEPNDLPYLPRIQLRRGGEDGMTVLQWPSQSGTGF